MEYQVASLDDWVLKKMDPKGDSNKENVHCERKKTVDIELQRTQLRKLGAEILAEEAECNQTGNRFEKT